jgi:CRISPR-associated exonuclease Cas4
VIGLVSMLVATVLLYVLLTRWCRREQAAVGLDHETVHSSDDSTAPIPTLRSWRYGLVGRPDQLVRVGRALVPVEQKPTARRLQPSHVLQVAAQCLLVQEVYGIRPPFGLVVLAEGVRQRVEFSPELERHLLETMAQMRAFLHAGAAPEPRWTSGKCRNCGFRTTCWGPDIDAV